MPKFDAPKVGQGIVEAYRESKSAYERTQIIGKNVRSLKPSQLRELVTHFYGDKTPVNHRDLNFLQRLLSYAIVQESGTLDEKGLESSQRHLKALLDKGPSLEGGEGEDQPAEEEEVDMETQTEKKKVKAKAEPKEKSTPKKREADWYDKDTKFLATPTKSDYSANSNSRPGIVYDNLKKPVTMSKLIEKFKAGMQESGLDKGVKGNMDSLANRFVPGLVKWLIERKAVKVAKEGDVFEDRPKKEAKKEAKSEKTEKKSTKKSKSKDAEA